ncbi:hypothetical protein [Actinomyces ruminicola]|uniref:hypothetical protein n=1 Tax=Actinomyces ruminicola TaxID=332524 RepID=UPI0011CB8433|nr:hypothetical protein [Actinomyces ruminicola]
MNEAHATLSLADVAKLAGVKRPVVSMWRKREVPGLPFPAAGADGRFAADEIVDWLEATGRGNNPEARADVAIRVALSASVTPQRRSALLNLLAARAMFDEPLAALGLEELLDRVDELDPDDEFLFSELNGLDAADYPELAGQADAIAESAWNPRAAYERLLDARTGPEHDDRLHPDLCEFLAELCRALRQPDEELVPEGELVDVRGACTDVVIAAAAQDDPSVPLVKIPADVPVREAQRRYYVHGMVPERCSLKEGWYPNTGSVALLRATDADDLALVDEVCQRLFDGAAVVVVGPASLLIDAVPAEVERRRDELIRRGIDYHPMLLQAAVRLPAGLTCGGSRQHLGLWLLSKELRYSAVWVGDISGASFDRGTRQSLLDDLLAAFRSPGVRAFSLLHAVRRSVIAANGGSLVSTGRSVSKLIMSPADDAAKIIELRRALNAPMPKVFDYELAVVGDAVAHQISLGDAYDAKQLRLLPGTRLAEVPRGATPLWTSVAVVEDRPGNVDLLKLTQQHPGIRLTEPDDVVFITAGKPAAVLDREGGAAVAYPARVLRIRSPRLSPAAVVDAINAVPAGNSKWRTWMVPVVQIDLELDQEIRESLRALEDELHRRLADLAALRSLVGCSVLSGAIQVARPNEQKGK